MEKQKKREEVQWQAINIHTINKMAWIKETSPPSDLSPISSVHNLKTNNLNQKEYKALFLRL